MIRTIRALRENAAYGADVMARKMEDQLSRRLERIITKVEERLAHVQRKIAMKIVSGISLGAAVISFVIAGYYLLNEFLRFSNTLSFLLIGAVFLIISLITKTERRNKYAEAETY